MSSLLHLGRAAVAGFLIAGGALAYAEDVRIQAGPAVVRPALPPYFISFNMNSITFEANYWDGATRQVRPEVVQAMRAFPGAIYRYPGGLIANGFDWEGAVGPAGRRRPQKNVDWQGGAPVQFGPAEYFDFLRQVDGRSWYVLNLVGWDGQILYKEQGSGVQAASNGRLAAFRREHEQTAADWHHYYHLGNELDRSEFQWPTEKYVQRSLDSMKAVRAADPDARFVPFLRDFDWHYRGRLGVSPAKDFARDVLAAMPEVQDYSLQIYYDRPSEEGKTFDVEWRSRLIRNIVDYTTSLRGKPYRVWITEHAKAKPEKAPQAYRLETTSGIAGAISSADFLIAMSQQPEVQGVFWHALGGGHWWDLFRSNRGAIEPTPVYWALRLLRENMAGEVLRTVTSGPNASGYEGGYDVRCLVLRNPQTGELTVWAINHATEPRALRLDVPASPGGTGPSVALGFVAARWTDGVLEHEMEVLRRQPDRYTAISPAGHGPLTITVPARSVSVARIRG
jgi:hypothetical protein